MQVFRARPCLAEGCTELVTPTGPRGPYRCAPCRESLRREANAAARDRWRARNWERHLEQSREAGERYRHRRGVPAARTRAARPERRCREPGCGISIAHRPQARRCPEHAAARAREVNRAAAARFDAKRRARPTAAGPGETPAPRCGRCGKDHRAQLVAIELARQDALARGAVKGFADAWESLGEALELLRPEPVRLPGAVLRPSETR